MRETVYDKHVQFYIDFVDRALADENGLWHVLLAQFKEIIGDRLKGARVCDIACGEGYLSRFLGQLGAQEVIGIDASAALIAAATQRSNSANLSYRVDDAQRLQTLSDASVDIAVSQLAIMDIPDHRAMFQSVRRVLRMDGVFVFSLLHPCFETPFREPDESPFLVDASGTPVACVVRRYTNEGFWQSGGSGVRGHMGAYHRTLSTLLNDLVTVGFSLEKIAEPVVEGVVEGSGLFAQVPRTLLVAAHTG
ncbi:MAG TPA: methyltransferase domain-containing protein [Anaerolineales bacterium]|nr:methyltransferase domain-containing protein [Anaerolineales bacterium]